MSDAPQKLARPSRRQLLLGLTSLPLAAPAHARGPWFHPKRRPRVRVLGTHVTLQERIRLRAEQDLGIELEFSPGGSAAVLQQASTRPESFDVFEQWSNTVPILWQAGAIEPIETERIDVWTEINDLAKVGRLSPHSLLGRGDSPHRMLYSQADGTLGSKPTPHVSFLPYVHNVDSFGYCTSVVPEGEPYETESWGWLLDERWRGRVALVNEPTIGLFDAALAVQAKGLMSFGDIGALTRYEVDALFDILIEMKRQGHFCGAWNSVPQSVDFVRKNRAVISSMFSPAVTQLNSMGIGVAYAAPREGYRAWHGVMCLSSEIGAETRDAAYRFLNWWLDGWAGAFIARQGYYISVPERARRYLDRPEWEYWYEGRPAAHDLPGTDGRTAVRAGSIRRGGSYEKRFANVAVWNTVMDTYEHSMLRWYEFLTA